MKYFFYFFVVLIFSFKSFSEDYSSLLFHDDFEKNQRGLYSAMVGAHTEYHYLNEAAPKNDWEVSTFTWEDGFMRAWTVRDENNDRMFVQTFQNSPNRHTHPMLITGDELWQNLKLEVNYSPLSKNQQSGIVFRYVNDRCYYFFGLIDQKAILKKVQHATAFHKPLENILAQEKYDWKPGSFLNATVWIRDNNISAGFDNKVLMTVKDDTYSFGKIGLMSDVPAKYSSVKVYISTKEKEKLAARINQRDSECKNLQLNNPKMVVWKKISTAGFGVGRNVRFGDLNNDGQIDVLIGQVVHFGPKDRNSELSCLTAKTFDDEILWQIGEPDPWKDHLTNDVAFQIHDFDGDGKNEVVYCMDMVIIVADGETGQTKYTTPTPASPDFDSWKPGQHNRFERILGDCLYFCDLRGLGRDSDLIIKDRYQHLWAYNDRLELLWKSECKTGHYPYAYDCDGDCKDELAMGYTLFDDNGTKLWSLDNSLQDHADGVAIVSFKQGEEPVLLNAASDEGMIFIDLKGKVLKHHYIGHCQNPAVANFRDDLPGLEVVSINFWGNQGIIHFYDSNLDIYHDFEPNQYGSMCLPINWTGKSEEFFVHNPNVDLGGLFDGWGRKAVLFPDDGHPDMCNAVLDITGDCRDEIVVWDAFDMWVYTQDDNPRAGKLYMPQRNPLYNYSNYQATVSLPGWQD